jgi:hypothetical protein
MDLPADAARALIERYARILARLGDEIGERPMVLPTAEYFPDEFRGDLKSVKRLARRMQKHAGMADVPVRVAVVAPDGEEASGGGGCGSGACAVPKHGTTTELVRVSEVNEEWLLQIPSAELRHPVVLTNNLARSLSLVFLLETRDPDQPIEEPLDATIDITAVALGFGELLLEGSHIYSKSCGGPSIGKVTGLTHPELALLTALFVALGDHSARKLKKQLPATQAESFDDAWRLVSVHKSLVAALLTNPERVADGFFKWKGLDEKQDDEPTLMELERELRAAPPKSKPKKERDPADDELSALVGEALSFSRSDAE